MFDSMGPVTNGSGDFARRRTTYLLSIDAGGALGEVGELAGQRVETFGLVRMAQNTRPHQKLYGLQTDMSKLLMPTEQFFLWFRQIEIVRRDGDKAR